jgi:hypothetical protein
MNITINEIFGILIGGILTLLGQYLYFKLDKNKLLYDYYQKEMLRKKEDRKSIWIAIEEMENANYINSIGICSLKYNKNDIMQYRKEADLISKEIELLSQKSETILLKL